MLYINKKTNFPLKQSGFTLIELLIVIAISSILLLATTQFFINTNKINIVKQKVADTQQSIRVAMEIMSRDIRMAGLAPPPPTLPAANAGFVNNGAGDETDSDSIAIRYDYNGDGVCEFDVAYQYNNVTQQLNFRNGAAAFQPLTETGTISSMSFGYILEDGTADPDPTTSGNLGQIRIVTITICGQITGVYSSTFNSTYCFNNTIKPRNL